MTQIAFTYDNPRQEQIDATYDNAHEAWKESYEQFVLDFAAKAIEPFSAETVRLVYEATDLPQTHKKQASGKLFQRLVKEGKLREAGMERSKIYGNKIQQYCGA